MDIILLLLLLWLLLFTVGNVQVIKIYITYLLIAISYTFHSYFHG